MSVLVLSWCARQFCHWLEYDAAGHWVGNEKEEMGSDEIAGFEGDAWCIYQEPLTPRPRKQVREVVSVEEQNRSSQQGSDWTRWGRRTGPGSESKTEASTPTHNFHSQHS
jgi:hypothetical protein